MAFLVLAQFVHFWCWSQIAPKPAVHYRNARVVPCNVCNVVSCACFSAQVDREKCMNTCFDTVFKGAYERKTFAGYFHVTFNYTSQSLKIWTITVVAIIAVYECSQYVVRLASHRKIRRSMLLLLLAGTMFHRASQYCRAQQLL